jgi:hypothetical protein
MAISFAGKVAIVTGGASAKAGATTNNCGKVLP